MRRVLPLWLALALLAPAGARAQTPPAPDRQIVITVDDIPGRLRVPTLKGFREINRRIVANLKAAQVPAIAFVNERFLHVDGERDARVDLLRIWLDGGMDLGNHLYRHLSLTRTPLPQYQDDVIRGEVLTRQVLAQRNRPLIWYRHPFLHTGPTPEIKAGFERFLADRGYRVAPATFDHSDWVFTRIYEQARAQRDRALEKRTRESFVAYFEQQVAFFEKVSVELFGREIPQILVTHANRINADVMPEWLALLKRRGYRFVSLDQALKDPAYATPDPLASKDGISWLHRWAAHLKRPITTQPEPEIPADLTALYEAIAAKSPEVNE